MPRTLPRYEPLPGVAASGSRARAISRLLQKGIITAMEANDLRFSDAPLPEEPPIGCIWSPDIFIDPARERRMDPMVMDPIRTDEPPTQRPTKRRYTRTGRYATKDTRPIVMATPAAPAVIETVVGSTSVAAHFERLALAALPPFDLTWSPDQIDRWLSAVACIAVHVSTLRENG